MTIVNFTPWSALVGGALIGVAAVMMLFFNGRIAGVSGITGALLRTGASEATWRIFFLLGLIVGARAYGAAVPVSIQFDGTLVTLILGGLLVGYGTQLGSGCTSGHGVCGIARLSPRSIVATAVFVGTAAATVYVVRHVLGGVP